MVVQMANSKWCDISCRIGAHGLNLGLKMNENFLDVLLGSRTFSEKLDNLYAVLWNLATYLAEQLDVNGISEVGYYLSRGRKVWL